MKFFHKILISLLIALLLEGFYFQLQTWRTRLDGNAVKDDVYTREDMAFINWHEEGDGYESDIDPIIYVYTEPMMLHSVNVRFSSNPDVTDCLFYYTAEDETIKVISGTARNGVVNFSLNKNIGPILRIDLGENPGVELKDIVVTVNPSSFHFSLSRVVTVVLLYVCGALLFRIQRMPDYTQYINKE